MMVEIKQMENLSNSWLILSQCITNVHKGITEWGLKMNNNQVNIYQDQSTKLPPFPSKLHSWTLKQQKITHLSMNPHTNQSKEVQ